MRVYMMEWIKEVHMKEDKSCCPLMEDNDYKSSSCNDGESDTSYDVKEEPLIENNYENIVNNMIK